MLTRVNGIDLSYDVAVAGDRPWVVLVHGFPFTRATWSAQVTALAEHFRVLTWDLRGLGGSELGPAPQPLETYVDDLLALLDEVGAERAGLCGLSMGGYIALRAVERAPRRFSALALADTRSEADGNEAKLARAAGIQARHRGEVEAFVRGLLPKLLLRPEAPAGRALLAQMLGNDPAGMANALAAMQGRTDTTPALAGLALPTLVLVGSGDTLTPVAASEALAATIPGAALQVLADAGHVSNLEAPEAFTAALMDFFTRHAPRGCCFAA